MAWVVVGSILRQGASFAVGVVIARMLGIVDFGTLAVIQSTVMMLAGFGQAGIGLSSTKYIAAVRSSDPLRAGRIIGFSLIFALLMASVMGVGLILSANWIAFKLVPGMDSTLELRLAALWIVFELLNGVQMRILAGLEAFSSGARINLWQALCLLPIVLAGAYSGALPGAVIGFSAVSLAGCILGQAYIRTESRKFDILISFRGVWCERHILRMSLMAWMSGMLMNAANWLAGIMLARQPMGIPEYAVFNATQRLQNVIIFIPNRIFQVSVPILSNLHASGSNSGFKKALLGAGAFGSAISACLALPVYLFAEQLMSWYGTDFARGHGVLEIVAVTSCISAAWTIATSGLWAAEQSGRMFLLDLFRGGMLLTLCFIGMAADAANLALAHLASYAAGTALLFLVLYRYTRKPWNKDDTTRVDTRTA